MGDWYTKVKAEFILNFVEDNRWKYLVTGLGNTLKITLAAVLLGIVIGTLVAIVRSTWDQNAERMRPGAGKSLLHIGDIICKIYLTVIRGTPVVVQLMIMFYIIFATSRNGVGVAMLAFGVNSGAYVAELIRGGIMAIDKGQLEAGRSLGFDYVQTMRFIIVPQALKNVLPALASATRAPDCAAARAACVPAMPAPTRVAPDCFTSENNPRRASPIARKSSMTRRMVARALASVSLFRAV